MLSCNLKIDKIDQIFWIEKIKLVINRYAETNNFLDSYKYEYNVTCKT